MRWSFRVGTIAGIGVYVHITFLVLIAFIFSVYFGAGGSSLAIQGTGLILAVFGCVLLHELGHALTARRFGVKAKDIVLLPIGGVARLERMPREPWHELLITIAGPLVNVLIAVVLYGLIRLLGKTLALDLESFAQARAGLDAFLRRLFEINVILAVFNLIPAFPMDGGRILRSLLALRLEYSRATRIAATVGQGFAVLFGLYGILTGAWLLVLIAAFVFIGAEGEATTARLQNVFRGLPVASATLTSYETLSADASLGEAVQKLLSGTQVDFPIVDGDRVLGVLTRQQLVGSLREQGPDARVGDLELKNVEAVRASDPLFHAWEELSRQQVCCLPVREDGALYGWITNENIAELAMVREALEAPHSSRPTRPPPSASRDP